MIEDIQKVFLYEKTIWDKDNEEVMNVKKFEEE